MAMRRFRVLLLLLLLSLVVVVVSLSPSSELDTSTIVSRQPKACLLALQNQRQLEELEFFFLCELPSRNQSLRMRTFFSSSS